MPMKDILLTFLVAMVPVVELRGAIPFGVVRGLNLWTAIIASVLGNLVPVPFIILFIRRIFAWMRAHMPKLDGLVTRMEKKAEKNRAAVEKYAFWGLAILVAIPLPGTGAWTGALVAAMMEMRLKRAFPAIVIGVVIAGVGVSGVTDGAQALFSLSVVHKESDGTQRAPPPVPAGAERHCPCIRLLCKRYARGRRGNGRVSRHVRQGGAGDVSDAPAQNALRLARRNLIDIPFETKQVAGSDEHRLLQALRESACADENARHELYSRVISSLDMQGENYLILLAGDAYDVPHRGADGEKDELSDEVFRFFVCTVCPVKDATAALRYFSEERAFHGTSTGQTVAAPALGFLFPAFDDRRANIYDALYYSHDTAEIHPELIDGLFRVAPPMSAAEQKETFSETLAAALDTDCRFDVVQAVHENLRSRIEEHKEAKDPDALEITARDVVSVLRTSGVPLEKTEKFERECEKRYGTHAALDPNNIVESKKLEIVTPEVKITLPGEFGYLVETREIDGRKYILIPADGGVEVNGIGVNLADAKKE